MCEVTYFENMTSAQLIYGINDQTTMVYWINTNYMNSSIARDYEDKLVDEAKVYKENICINIKEFYIEDEGTRWLIEFENSGAYYSIYVMNVLEEEIEYIIQNLFF